MTKLSPDQIAIILTLLEPNFLYEIMNFNVNDFAYFLLTDKDSIANDIVAKFDN